MMPRFAWSKTVCSLLLGLVVMAGGCERPDLHRIVQRNVPPVPNAPKLLAVYMPWFGADGHASVGYSSQDPDVLRRQVEQARSMGISAFVVDWYGDRDPYLDRSFALLQEIAAEAHFQVALMYDEPADGDQATDDALRALRRAYKEYIGPEARFRDAYLTYNGRPVLFVFPKTGRTDWNRVRSELNSWAVPAVLLYKDEPPANYVAAFDGFYPWIHPGSGQWASDGSDWGEQYLQNFYKNMKTRHAGKIPVGAAWPGFDDAHASWGLNRYMASRCGKTLDDTLRLSRQYYDDSNPLPFLLIETWNDYEEGSAIERPAPAGCSGNQRTVGAANAGR